MRKLYKLLFGFGLFLIASSLLNAQSSRFELSEGSILIRQEKAEIKKESPNIRPNPRVVFSENPHPEDGQFTTKHGGVELIGKRDEYSKTFQNPDGTYGKIQSKQPMHYRDAHGNWLTYSEDFGKIDEHNFGLLHTNMPVFVSKESGQTTMGIDQIGNSLVFKPEFSMSYVFNSHIVQNSHGIPAGNIEINASKNEVTWRNAWTGIDRNQKMFLYDIETDYVIKEKPVFEGIAPSKLMFTEKILIPQSWNISYGNGKQTELGWQGELLLTDLEGMLRATFEEPIYFDSPISGKANAVQGAYSFEKQGDYIFLSVVVDMNWLMNGNLSFPVIIDPVVSNSSGGDRNVGPTSGSSASCQHTMNVNVPAGIISLVESTFPMEARNSGWRNEQRVNFAFNGDFSGDLGPNCNLSSGGTCNWLITGFIYLNHSGGNIEAVMQPWKTWASSGENACNQYNQRIQSNWIVYVAYSVQTGNEIVFDWVGNIEQMYVVPDGYCQAEIEVWGAGGGGGGTTRQIFYSSSPRAAGGGGGAYSRVTVSVEENDALIILVGGGGPGGSGAQDGAAGQTSYVDRNFITLASAAGGQGGRYRRGDNSTGSATGAGGNSGVGFLFAGGNGGTHGSSGNSGGGGGAGGSTQAGTNGSTSAAGAGGSVGGGNGGAPKTSGDQNGDNGLTPGGGASGARRTSNNGSTTGGRGGDGKVVIKLTPNPADGSLNAVSSTTVCLGDAITVAPSGGEGTPKYWIQSPVGHPTWNIAENQAPNAAGDGYTFTPLSAGTYRVHARWENTCGFCWDIPGHDWVSNNKCPEFAYVDFEVVEPSTTPSSIDVTGLPVCHGGKVELTVVGGSLSSGANWEWFASSCASSVIGTGSSIEVSPSATTEYFVRASSGTGCAASSCQSVSVNMPNTTTNLSIDGNFATCKVNVDGWIHFYNVDGLLIASVNSNNQDLGDVTARSYVAASPYQTSSCTEPTNASFYQANLQRTFVINAENPPISPVKVRLYILDSEVSAYQAAAVATTQNTLDDIPNGLQDLHMSKISGGANTGDPTDFCGSGGTAEFIIRDAYGNINDLTFAGFTATSYLEFTINGFSEFFPMNSDNSALPISLNQFSANCLNDRIRIQWTTASEFNASHYELQSSRDGFTWLHLAEIDAAGTTNQTSQYSYDVNSQGALTYYRLVQVDFDGAQQVYGPISANCALENNIMTVYPNPTNDKFAVYIQTSESFENAVIELVDMTGRVLSSQTADLNSGSIMLNFEGKELHAGTYMIRVKGQNDKFTPIRVVKM